MKQLILTIDDEAQIAKIKNAVKLLTGVVSVREKRSMPNKETMASIEEAKRGEYAGELDATSPDTIMRDIMNIE